MLPLVGRVIAQTRARILGGDTHFAEKLLSLFVLMILHEDHGSTTENGGTSPRLLTLVVPTFQTVPVYET